MKTALLIPTRGDRPRFLEQCKRLIANQTAQPDIVLFMDYPPESEGKDITQRYRRGYDQLRNKELDVIFFWEDDDYYCPEYIETMLKAWEEHGKPELFGLRFTEYYNIKTFEHFTMLHEQRSSAMSMMIKPDLFVHWPPDHEPYTDSHLWMGMGPRLKGELFKPDRNICLGIKHGDGMCGGEMHTTQLGHYKAHGTEDLDKKFLRSNVDPVSFEFYSNYFMGL